MKFDLRIPIGTLFVVYGALLVAYGLGSDAAQYARSLDININLTWGGILVIGGAALLAFTFRCRHR